MTSGDLVALRPNDRVRQDAEPIATIYRSLGATSAEQVVTRALTELAMTMAGLALQVRTRDMGDMDRQLRRLQRMSENLGMVSLGSVAGQVRDCLIRSDVTAFSAVWARLLRVAERSLATDRDVLGQTQI
ncbi:MAG: hypothetical protein ABI832_04470 [bacterium]